MILSLGFVSADDCDFSLQDAMVCEDLDDGSNLELEDKTPAENPEDLSSDYIVSGSDMDEKGRVGSGDLGEDYYEYVEDIQNSSSENYYSFFRYLMDDCGFEFRNTSNVGDGYLLYATNNYTGLLFDGEEFTILPDEYYFVSTNDRVPYYVNHIYYDDIVYCHEDNYILDEEYLGWLIWNSNTTNRDFSFGTLDDLDISVISDFYDYYSRENNVNTRDVVLPSSYDLRDFGFVTPVKDQGNSKNCWAFATMAALESYLLKFENTSYNLSARWDFSENNLKNVMSSRGRNGTDHKVDDGGNMYMALAYLLRWSGPVNETDDPYWSGYNLYEENLSPLKHVQGVQFIPNRTNPLDNDAIKEAIYNYGGVVVSMYWDNIWPFLKDDGKSYYFLNVPDYNMSNKWHEVTIVGWDDDYSSANFGIQEGLGDGAFIVKNSWGDSVGENGYFYVSYYDQYFARSDNNSFVGFAFTSVENVTNYADNYNYNPLGLVKLHNENCTIVKFANQWVANKNETLKSIGFYLTLPSICWVDVFIDGVSVGGTNYTYLNYSGFHTLNLNQGIGIGEGQNFRVEVSLYDGYANNYIPVGRSPSNYPNVPIGFNQSFIWSDVNGVFDWVDVSYWNYSTVCLHAFTEFVPDLIASEIVAGDLDMVYNDGDLNATLRDAFGNPLVGKRVSFSFNDKTYYRTSDENGNVSLHIGLFPGSYVFEIKFLGDDDYYSSSKLVSVNVGKKATNIVCTMTSCYYNEKLNFTLKDSSGNALANKSVAFLVKGKTYKRVTDSNGRASLSINLNNGTCQVVMKFYGDRSYNVSNKTINLLVKKAPARVSIPSYQTPHNSGVMFNITVINNKTNNVITGTTVKIRIYTGNNYKEYYRATNSNGVAQINLSVFGIGNHQVIVSSNNTNVVFTPITRTIKILSG